MGMAADRQPIEIIAGDLLRRTYLCLRATYSQLVDFVAGECGAHTHPISYDVRAPLGATHTIKAQA